MKYTYIISGVKTRIKLSFSILLSSLLLFGCELPIKTVDTSAATPPSITFDYSSTIEVTAQGTFHSGSGNVLEGVLFKLYTEIPTDMSVPISNGISDKSGNFTVILNLPTASEKIYLQTNYIGVPSLYEIPITNTFARFDETRIVNIPASSFKKSGTTTAAAYVPPVKYLGTWKSDGTPNYLEPTQDIIDAGFLARVNESLPETQSLPKSHPEYLTTSDKSMIINERADVWVTFIHEGAGYMNVLGFYTYPVGKAPTTTTEIDSITIVFPNVSYSGSGGGLKSGDKVKIGRFEPNTAIGWVVFSNGYSGGKVGTGNWMLFSTQSLNGVTNPSLQQHNVLLNDAGFNRVVLGFEDIKRDTGGDQDFNDCLFSVTSNPVTAIVTEQLAKIDVPVDTDGDGVTDKNDAYPADLARAFDSYTPGLGSYNTLAFEDLFPGRGDDDFNDLVISYTSHQISDAKNNIVALNMTYVLRAVGASNKLGFGFELPVSPSQVASVTIDRNNFSATTKNGNGTEAGQNKATVILFDNAYTVIKRSGTPFVNTESNGFYVQPETIRVSIGFSSPVVPSVLGSAPFNPFIFVNDRSKEIHLPNNAPTLLADQKYFGTSADNSKPGSNRYYMSKENKPWALNIPGTYEYPIEKIKIQTGYLNFMQWATSNGTLSKDWYSSKSGNRDPASLWKKK